MNIQRIGRISIGFAALCMGSAHAGELATSGTSAAEKLSPIQNSERIDDLEARVTRLHEDDTAAPITVPSGASSFVFVTSETFNGNLGGFAGADDKCQQVADDREGGALEGQFKAWVALEDPDVTPNTAPNDRFVRSPGAYVLPPNAAGTAGGTVADSYDDLIAVDNQINVAIDTDENGTPVGEPTAVWTNVRPRGTSEQTDDCSGWLADSGAQGSIGAADQSGEEWTSVGEQSCATPARLYCFGQGDTVKP